MALPIPSSSLYGAACSFFQPWCSPSLNENPNQPNLPWNNLPDWLLHTSNDDDAMKMIYFTKWNVKVCSMTLSRVVWNILRHPLMLPTILLLMTYKVFCFVLLHLSFLHHLIFTFIFATFISPFLHHFIFSYIFATFISTFPPPFHLQLYLCPGWLFNWRGRHLSETC